MDADKKLAVERDNARLGRGMVYMLAIGMGLAFLISYNAFEPVWAHVVSVIVGGPILALVLYLPLSFILSLLGFGAKSFVPKSKDE